ncbi:Wzz/FepE/Etk N-terminal domain-containing protein [Vibrio owensii]|uniref:Wzz/FepE/Etk N-terminal domain-containing protein n=1 Tax=Vibrio owensii TaxID=696485 RepID=UPI0021D190EA
MEPHKNLHQNHFLYPAQQQVTGGEIDLRDMLTVLWQEKWTIVVTTLVFAISSVLYATSLPNIYKADALLAPTESSENGGLAKMAGQFSGLAAIAGVNLSNSESSQTDLAVQVLKSRQFVGAFIQRHDLKMPLMAAKGWDLDSNKLILDENIYNETTGQWLRKAKGLRTAEPTEQEMFDVFRKDILSISQDKENGFYTLSVRFYDPFLAKQWVSWLIDDINKVMRDRAITETSQNLMYLNAQLQKTAVADMQSAFYTLIEEQTKNLMLAEVQEEFIFKVIDPAVVPEVKDGPKRLVLCILGSMLGGMLGVVFAFVRYVFRKKK